MKILILSRLAGVINRLIDVWNKHNNVIKRKNRDARREGVKSDPGGAFSDLFGPSEQLSDDANSDSKIRTVRSDASNSIVD